MKKKKFEHKPHHTMLFYSLVATPIVLYQIVKYGAANINYALMFVSLFAGMAFVIGMFKYWEHSL
jgi:ABC-type Co2+ transport system permease subunit